MPIKEILATPLPGIFIIQPHVFTDDRGYFYESYIEKQFVSKIGNITFVQDNVSRSKNGTVRGLHYQIGEYAQGKLCSVLFGTVIDVAVDIRFGSPTFGKYFSQELSDENKTQLWIPPGFAHGFSVLSEEAVFHYKCTAYYSKEHERSIRFNDPAINIQWNVNAPLVSAKDLESPFINEIKHDFHY